MFSSWPRAEEVGGLVERIEGERVEKEDGQGSEVWGRRRGKVEGFEGGQRGRRSGIDDQEDRQIKRKDGTVKKGVIQRRERLEGWSFGGGTERIKDERKEGK